MLQRATGRDVLMLCVPTTMTANEVTPKILKREGQKLTAATRDYVAVLCLSW